jgi:hypothetical protein
VFEHDRQTLATQILKLSAAQMEAAAKLRLSELGEHLFQRLVIKLAALVVHALLRRILLQAGRVYK